MFHLAGTLHERQTPQQFEARERKRVRRGLTPKRSRLGPIAFEAFEPARKIDAVKIHQELKAVEGRISGRISGRRIGSILDRTSAFLRSVQLAGYIQRCAFQNEREDPTTQKKINGAPCGGRLKRQGALLTCQACGRTAQG